MRRAIVVRHAQSERNAAGTIGGDPPLSEAGRTQARALADRLPHVDLAAPSGLRRAVETAQLAAPEAPLLVVSDLAEIHFGHFEGGSLDAYREWAWSAGPEEPCPGGGESRAEAVRRYARSWSGLLARPEETVLVVAHGLVVRYLLDALEGRGPAQRADGVPWAVPFPVDAEPLEAAVGVLERWLEEPRW